MGDNDLITDDDWLLEDDPPEDSVPDEPRPWRVLIVDDEPDIHAVTRFALDQVRFKGRGLELLSAYSASEGFEVLSREKDVALVLLDVVMETEDAGLRLAQRIRNELGNQLVRIVLRTGQPGNAPEEQVIVDFDINDYKGKTELTKQKLFTTVISSLRAYEGMVAMERSSLGLRKILQGAGDLYQQTSLKEFASGVLNQIGAILDVGADGVLCVTRPTHEQDRSPFNVIAATGCYADLVAFDELPQSHEWSGVIERALHERASLFEQAVDVLYVPTRVGHDFVIVLTPPWPLAEIQRNLLSVFCDRISAAFDNLHMVTRRQLAQEATVVALADLAESRDPNTGGHVQRVCRLTQGIAEQLHVAGKLPDGLPPRFLAQVGLASMLHDVGKVATPDAVLLKPGLHTSEERSIMQQHAQAGELVLARAAKLVDGDNYLTLGAQIAGSHHEHFDGSGYLCGLSGSAIPFAARIVAVVDVFDALVHQRPYKAPWPLAEALAYVHARSGSQFDPDVVAALDDFLAVDGPQGLIGDAG